MDISKSFFKSIKVIWVILSPIEMSHIIPTLIKVREGRRGRDLGRQR